VAWVLAEKGEIVSDTADAAKCRHGLPPENCQVCSGYPGRLLHPGGGHPCNCHFCSWARLSSFERQFHPYQPPK